MPGAGTRQRSVVTEPARQPTKSTRSAASTTARVAGVPPFEPTTPTHSGCVSGSEPWPLIVVHTGMPSAPAKRSSAASAPDRVTPPPQTTTGDRADNTASRTAATSAASGAARCAGNAP